MHLHPSFARALGAETQAEHLRRAARAGVGSGIPTRPLRQVFRRRRIRLREAAPTGTPVLRVVRP